MLLRNIKIEEKLKTGAGSHCQKADSTTENSNSYVETFRAASIVGGAEGLSYLIGLVRTKVVAVLLGPTGVGLLGLYLSYINMLQVIGGLGIASSGVRAVAEDTASADSQKIAETAKTLRRVCWFTGMLGLLLSAAFALPASILSGESESSAIDFALLGVAVFITLISAGQSALLQGARRLADLARVKLWSALLTTIFAIIVYSVIRDKGIVLVLIATPLIHLVLSWHFVRRVPVLGCAQTWFETMERARRLLGLGLSFLWSGLLGAGVTMFIGFFIVHHLGVEANGIFGAASMLSTLFGGFILSAMGSDFYPKLTAVQYDHEKMKRLVNEQTEVGILLALPGLMATLAFAPLVINVFYSSKFLPAAELMPWLILGVFGQVVTWPMGYILMAKDAKLPFLLSETLIHSIRLAVSLTLMIFVGLEGLSAAMLIVYTFHAVIMLSISHRLIGFAWNRQVLKLLFVSSGIVIIGFWAEKFLPAAYAVASGFALTVLTAFFCTRGIALRLGFNHKLVRLIASIPGGRLLVSV